MREHIFSVTNNNSEKLAGVLSLPDEPSDKPLPLVLLLHGFAYYKEEDGLFVEIPSRLTRLGYACVRFDFSGCGESEGDYSKTSLSKLVKDTHSIIKYLSNNPKIDTKNLSLIGQSFGTTVSIVMGQNAKKIVLMGSFADPLRLLSEHMDEYNPESISSKLRSNGNTTFIEPRFWKDLKTYDLVKLVAEIKAPILYINGADDDVVSVKDTEPLLKATKNSQHVLLQGANHGLSPKQEEVYRIIEKFFGPTNIDNPDHIN